MTTVIVNIASIAGLVGFAGLPAYAASKHGIVGLTRNAALEYAKSEIRVNAVCPGPVQTEMIERIMGDQPEMRKNVEATIPSGKFADPKEIADAVVWLCSEQASYVNGHPMPLDAGWVAQ